MPKGWTGSVKTDTKRKSTLPKVNLRPEQFNQLILDQGVRVKIFRSVPCPNLKDIESGIHEIDCPLCHGTQFVDRYPIEANLVIQSVQSEMSHLLEGLYDGNTVTMTFPSGIEAQYFTLVELLDFTENYIQRVSRQEGKVDNLKFKGIHVNLLIDQHGREYFEGSDFHLDINGNIAWVANKGPTKDTIYSIHYETLMRYRTVRALHVNRFGNVTKGGKDEMAKMPETWVAYKVFLVDRNDQLGNLIGQNKLPRHDIANDDQ